MGVCRSRWILFLSLAAAATAGASALAATGNYLGQEPPGIVPTRFAASLLGENAFSGTFSPDLAEFWFTRQDPATKTDHLEGYVLVGGEWQHVSSASFAAVPDAMEPHIAPRGDRLFFTGAPRPDRRPT